MGLIEKLFRNTINRQVDQRVTNLTTNLFNQNVFKFLFEGDIIIPVENYNYIEKGFESVGAVYECVDIITKKFIACPRLVYRIKDQKEYKKYLNFIQSPETLPQALIAKAKAMEEVNMPKIEKLLYQPNPEYDGDATFETLCARHLLTGNAYVYGNAGNDQDRKAGKWSEAWAVPGDMLIKSGGWMEPIQSYVLAQYTQNTPFPAVQIKHVKTLNPAYRANGQNLYGMPPLKAYIYSMDTIKNADRQADKQVKNGGKMGLLSPENPEDNWSADQIEQMQQSLKDAHKSNNALDRMIPLSVAMKFTEIGLSSSEMELIKIKEISADDIYRCFHIPLQFRSQDTATYNNLPVANRQMVYNAVAPICRKFSIALTEFYCKPYNTTSEQYCIEIDFTGLPELNDDIKTVVEWLSKATWLTPNEKREVMRWGRSPEAGMDQMWVKITDVRMEDILSGKVQQGPAHLTPPENTPPAN